MTAQTEFKSLSDQLEHDIRNSAFPPFLKVFVQLWLSLSLAGLLIYLGLSWLGVALPDRSTGFLAVGAIAASIAILLAMDQQAAEGGEDLEDITFAGLAYVLLTKRLPLLALLLFGLLGIVMAAYYVVTSLVTIEFTGASGFFVKLPGQTIYYYPVHPYGWQNTHIQLDEGDKFEVEITGEVTPGYLQKIAKLQEQLKLSQAIDVVQWPLTGPEGYDERLYEELVRQGMPHYEYDTGLTVQGYPHNYVIGVIIPEAEDLYPRNRYTGGGKDARTPCVTKNGGQGYRRYEDQGILHVFSSPSYPLPVTAKRSGQLWVTINDTDAYRWDNLGLFFMKLTKR